MVFSMEIERSGVVQVGSESSFDETFSRLTANVKNKGLTVFATINFTDDAKTAGLEMNPTRMIIFGNPKSGTPLMIATPTLTIDFPLKVVVFQDNNRKVWLLYNSPKYLKKRHGFPD